ALHQPPPRVVVDLDRRAEQYLTATGWLGAHLTPGQVDGHLGPRAGLDQVGQGGHLLLGQADGQQAGLNRVVTEDIPEARRDHGAEPVVEKRPYGVLTG